MFRLTAFISGRVQKVGYRARVVALAGDMGLAGFVQNLPDGRVEVVAEGKRDVLERFAAALKIKNTFIDVKDIEAEYSEAAGGYTRFHKISASGEVGDRLDEGIEILKEMSSGIKYLGSRMDMMLDKQDQALGKMDMMLDKQDQALGKMDMMLDRQDQALGKTDMMLDRQDQMLDKQDDTISEIKGLKPGLNDHMDRRFEKIECELAGIKSALKERGII